MKKHSTAILLSLLFSIAAASTAFAGTWKMGEGANEGKWWYERSDGTYPVNSWEWIDSDGDQVAECYCFNGEGWAYMDTTTPDGYEVDCDGKWLMNGAIRTDWVSESYGSAPFVSYGENTQNSKESGYAQVGGQYDANIQMPVFKECTIFNPDRNDKKRITLKCATGCKMYYTIGYNPPDPTEEDEQYKLSYDSLFGVEYGSPLLDLGDTLKVVAIRTEDGSRSGVTTLRYEDAHSGNKGRSGNIAGSSNGNPGNNNNSSNTNGNGQGSSSSVSRRCPVCAGRGRVTCMYCHGVGLGHTGSTGVNGGVGMDICPLCGGSGYQTCSGCGGSGELH